MLQKGNKGDFIFIKDLFFFILFQIKLYIFYFYELSVLSILYKENKICVFCDWIIVKVFKISLYWRICIMIYMLIFI